MGKLEPLCSVSRNEKWCSRFGKQYRGSSEKKKGGELPYDPAIPVLGIYPKKLKSGFERESNTPMFTAALFPTAKM